MKVTVTFGKSPVVVPCRDGWTVRDLIQQATQRYMKILEQEGDFMLRTHHVEYLDGGILDPDDILADLVEDKEKLVAVYEVHEALPERDASPGGSSEMGHPSPEPYDSELSGFQDFRAGEIEVNSSVLKSDNPLLVRSSSESALIPPMEPSSLPLNRLGGGPSPQTMTPVRMERDAAGESSRAEAMDKSSHFFLSGLTKTVEISGEHGPLGIHVVPYNSSLSGRALGLLIRGVEENSRSKREGIFHEEDCIVKINDSLLLDKTFSQSQDVFRLAMRSSAVQLHVVPVANRQRYEKSVIGLLFNAESQEPVPKSKHPSSTLKADTQRIESPATSPEPAVHLGRPPESPTPRASSSGSGSPATRASPALGTIVASRKGGKKLKIDLLKGPDGLGFTVVTRDASVHGPGPILVKNILPRGAAVKDGRLQSGDRILEVNGADMTGCTQEELVGMLRATKQNDIVSLMVVRQEEMFLPRELKGDHAGTLQAEEEKAQLLYEIPLNDSGSAGLGVSLKGNRSRETGEDLGIFIKSIIHGGAAYKDGCLRPNDQLIAVNGETLLGKSNHEAMETLRRSMSMEGNVRGMIQLMVVRPFDRSGQDTREVSSPSSLAKQAPQGSKANTTQLNMLNNSIYEPSVAPIAVTNGGHEMVQQQEEEEEEEEDDEYPPLPPRQEDNMRPSFHPAYYDKSLMVEPSSPPGKPPSPDKLHNHVKSSKSMDLVADESNVGSLVRPKPEAAPVKELGPTLGLKKSSSLESLQTAMSEVKKNELPFHRPRPHMVRGRGCNESFRAAIDKSYDGPSEPEDDDLSDQSSGRDTPASSSSRQDVEEVKKDKKKAKGKKKDKLKAKAKEKDKKKLEELDDQDRKTKKKGFGLLRFAKKKEDKGKSDSKATQQKQKSEVLSEEELEKMKEERERIEAKHQELRDRQTKDRFPFPDMEDDDMDPNYARISHFREPPPHGQTPLRNRTPSPQRHLAITSHSREPSGEEHLDGLYAKVNKQKSPPAALADSNGDRIQQLRREYQQARREGAAPPYEELEIRRRGHNYDPHRMPARGPDLRMAPRYEDVERQYASLPRGPANPADYSVPSWARPPQRDPAHREPPHYTGPLPGYQDQYQYPRGPDRRAAEPGYYPGPPPQRGPLRQDVPPSPTMLPRAPRYDTMNRTGYRTGSPERYAPGDPRQKNPMTAAV